MTNTSPATPDVSPRSLPHWLAGSLQLYLRGTAQIEPGAVLVIHSPYARLVRAILTVDQPDSVIAVDADPTQARSQLAAAIRRASESGGVIVPVGAAASSTVTLGGEAIPLPWSKAVLIVEAPFQVPGQTAQIPDSWTDAVERLLTQAAGRARDILATWKHTGQSPEPT